MPCLSAASVCRCVPSRKSSRLVRFLVVGIDNCDEMWLMESVTKEVRNACTTPSWQPPARAICPLEAARDFAARESSDGGLDDTVDWTEMEMRAEKIRAKKLKNAAGRPPQLRATLGALTLMAIRKMPYREAEEQIRYYAPARYLCG